MEFWRPMKEAATEVAYAKPALAQARKHRLGLTRFALVVQAVVFRLPRDVFDERHPHGHATGRAEWMLRFWRYDAVLVGVLHDCGPTAGRPNRHNSNSQNRFLQEGSWI